MTQCMATAAYLEKKDVHVFVNRLFVKEIAWKPKAQSLAITNSFEFYIYCMDTKYVGF